MLNQKSKANHTISDEKKKELQLLFLTPGITSYQAALKVGVHHTTAKTYYEMFAKELVDNEEHESWIDLQTRVKARILEGISKTIIKIGQRLDKFEKMLDIALKDKDHDLIVKYETIVRRNTQFLVELQAEFGKLEALPPPKEVLKQEIRKMVMEEKEKHPLSTK